MLDERDDIRKYLRSREGPNQQVTKFFLKKDLKERLVLANQIRFENNYMTSIRKMSLRPIHPLPSLSIIQNPFQVSVAPRTVFRSRNHKVVTDKEDVQERNWVNKGKVRLP